MAASGSVGRMRVAVELLLLSRLPLAWRVIVSLTAGIACCALGAWSLVVQHHFAAQPVNGRVGSLLAEGSSVATAWVGWAAAGFFALALLRLRREAPEPPAGRTPVEQLTAGQIRAGLMREYTVARAGLVVVCLIALSDLARAARYLVAAAGADPLAGRSLAATMIESCGLVVAAVVLGFWATSFRDQLERMGALVP